MILILCGIGVWLLVCAFMFQDIFRGFPSLGYRFEAAVVPLVYGGAVVGGLLWISGILVGLFG